MAFGLFKKKVKVVKVKKKAKTKKRQLTQKRKKAKTKRTKVRKSPARPKRKAPIVKKTKKVLQKVGEVTHYFPHVKAGVISVTKGPIALGETLHFKGHTTDFKQKVNSMQINNAPIKEAKRGQEIGLLVKFRVRHHDLVYKL